MKKTNTANTLWISKIKDSEAVFKKFPLRRPSIPHKEKGTNADHYRYYLDHFESFLSALPYPVQLFDRSGLLVMLNKAFIDLYKVADPRLVIGKYNILKDPVMKEIGAFKHLARVFKGEICIYPRLKISPEKMNTEYGFQRHGDVFSSMAFIPVLTPGSRVDSVVTLTNDITGIVRAEEKLHQSEAAFGSMMHAITEAAMLIETDGTIVAANKTIVTPFNETPESIIGKNILAIMPPEESRQRKKDLDMMLRTRKPVIHEIVRENRNYQMSVSPVFDKYDKISRVAIFCTNITARKQAEEELKVNEERMRALLENSSDMIEVVDEQGIIRYVSPSMKRVLGYDHHEPLGEHAFKIIHPEDIRQVQDGFEQALKNPDKPVKILCRCLHRNGTWRYLETWAKNNLGNPAIGGIILNIRDITEHIRNQEIIHESEEKFRSIIEQTYDGITIIDDKGTIIVYNKAQEQLSGIPAKEVLGQKIWDVQYRVMAESNKKNVAYEAYKKGFKQLLKTGESVWLGKVLESEMVRPDGTHIIVQDIISPIRFMNKIAYAAHSRNVTRLRQTENSLKKREQELSDQNVLLQQKNIAMRELMGQIETEKKNLGIRVLANVDRLITPVIAKLKSKGSDLDRTLLNILEENLSDLTAGFGSDISRKMYHLTQKEIEMCNMIRQGFSSKEIGRILSISTRTVDTHRNRIRKKLGITDPEINLVTYLKSQMHSTGEA